jgi:hypothetical protein
VAHSDSGVAERVANQIPGEQAQHDESQQELLAKELLKGDVAALAKAARSLDAREKELREKLDEARAGAARPAGERWGEAMSLIDVLDNAPDPKAARLRLRSLLGRLVSEIQLLVVPLSAVRRLAAVQLHFENGAHRDVLLFCQAAGNGRRGYWWAKSFSEVALAGVAGSLDLRRRDHVRRLAAVLSTLPLP